jgi:hypothetical protein
MKNFRGFSPSAIEFYEQLQVHNTRSWWSEHKGTYEQELRDPMRAMPSPMSSEMPRSSGRTAMFDSARTRPPIRTTSARSRRLRTPSATTCRSRQPA